jgi:glycine/D-amino acid oxidase-like deaminating enzyme
VKLSRRRVLKGLAAAPAARLLAPSLSMQATAPRVAVIGAGAFGGWAAYHLLRSGARVTLVDAWGPGNSRASSGGESRVIRAIYGSDRIYVQLVARSYQLWREAEERFRDRLYFKTGGLWLFRADDSHAKVSLPLLKEQGLTLKPYTLEEARKLYPLVSFDSVRHVYFEEDAGYLLARRACQRVVEGFVAEGGSYLQQAAVLPGRIAGGSLKTLSLSDGSSIEADSYVFACGPWLSRTFPDAFGNLIRPSRQEVFFFGMPQNASDAYTRLPVWIEFPEQGQRLFYGIPGGESRGFKIADDTRGEDFDPTEGDRTPTREGILRAREFLARRFPGLKDAPLVESRVCQYENSPDEHYVFDRHPGAENVWVLGGGSGHGYKNGPALGEHAAARILGKAEIEPFFSLSRLTKKG